MRFFEIPATGVERFTFAKSTSNRVEGLHDPLIGRHALECSVQMSDHRAIQKAQYPIRIRLTVKATVFRHRQAGCLLLRLESAIGAFDELYVFTNEQVQTMAQIDDGADDRGIFIITPCDLLRRPFACADVIGFPKIGARAEPVIGSFTSQNIDFARDRAVGNAFLAPMICEYK